MSDLPRFIVVMCVAPRGEFRRCGLLFTRTWRPLQIGSAFSENGPVPTITPEQYDALNAVAKPQYLKKRLRGTSEKEGEANAGPLVNNEREHVGPPMLSLRPATEEEVSELLEAQPIDAANPAAVADLKMKLAELEARQMRAELSGGGQAAKAELAATRRENDELRAQLADAQTAQADTNARLAKLEALLAGGGQGGQGGQGAQVTQADGKVAETKPLGGAGKKQ